MATSLIPAAQYLRMSTEHQQYSVENQSAAIQNYADSNGFQIVQTYLDSARSGVVLRSRMGLQALLKDVIRGDLRYQAILVYDVSRWGRFQDADEAAHYEFLCKSAGVPVHYCAETFPNDGSMSSLLMKALKRSMAGEYSRELGVKVLAGQKRLAALGFKQGGPPGYGLRRMLVSADRAPKQMLSFGEKKSLATDRVILVPGPESEIETVKDVFRMLISEGRTVYSIARELNGRRTPYLNGSKWDYQAVHNILTQPKYSGCYVFGRTSRKLCTPSVKLPSAQWVVTPNAFDPIVDIQMFEAAQKLLRERVINWSDEMVLGALKALLVRKGRLSLRMIQETPGMPSPSTYRHRFGGLKHAYELVGYGCAARLESLATRWRTLALRERLITRITEEKFPGQVFVVKRSGRWKSRLRFPGGRIVSLLIARSYRRKRRGTIWQVDPNPNELKLPALLARLNEGNTDFIDFYVLPRIQRTRALLSLNDSRLTTGKHVLDISDLLEAVASLHCRRHP